MSTTAHIYCRFSPRPDAKTSQSNEVQLAQCMDYIKAKGYTFGMSFQDRSKSGRDLDRPGLWNAVHEMKRGQVLVVYKLDRLARDPYISEIIAKSVLKKKGRIEAVDGPSVFKDETPTDKLIRRVVQAVDAYQCEANAMRTKYAMLRRQKMGQTMSRSAPFGFSLNPKNRRLLVVNPEEQDTVARIMELREEGVSLRKICRQLMKEGRKSRNPKNTWHNSTVLGIIEREKANQF